MRLSNHFSPLFLGTNSSFPYSQPAETTVLLHCSASSGRQWRRAIAALPKGTVALTPDLLGYAEEPWAPGVPCTLAQEAHAVFNTLARHGLPDAGRIHLVGHSYGGAVALELALEYPALFASLTLYEPVRFALLRAHQPQSAWWEVVNMGESTRRLGHMGLWHAAAQKFTDYWSGLGTWESLPESRQALVASRMPKVVAEFGALFADDLTESRLASLTMPVRVIRGTTSPAPARELAALISNAVPYGELITLEGLGHMGPIEAPDKVMGAVVNSLRREEALA